MFRCDLFLGVLHSLTTITFTSPPTSPTYAQAPLGCRVAMIRATSPLPLPAPSTSRRADIPDVDIPPQKRLCLTATTPRFEVGESPTAADARQSGSTVARRADYSLWILWMPDAQKDRAALRDERLGRIATSGSVRTSMFQALEAGARVDTLEDTGIFCSSSSYLVWHAKYYGSPPASIALGQYFIFKMAPKKRTATTTTTTTPMTDAQLKTLIAQGVVDALAEHDADRSRNGDDSHDSGTGERRQAPPTRECTYSYFLKCQPLNFKGTEGVVGLTQWFEKMESIFHISNCTITCQIKFATCTLQGNALTWWNSHVKTITHEVAYAMTRKTLKKMTTDKYCPRCEIKNLEIKMWNLKVKGTDVGLRKRNRTEDLNLYALNATITMTGSVLPNAPTARGLAIRPRTVEASLLLPTTTIEPKGKIKEFSLALSVEL
ncbi:hypothetical protein Tco_1074390 [Tanacetum coccineum]